MVRDERKIGIAGGDATDRDHVDPERRSKAAHLDPPRGEIKIPWRRMHESRNGQQDERRDGGDREHRVCGSVIVCVRREYRRQHDVLTFTHTEVPGALQGQGIGSRLVGLALDDVRRQGQKIVPRCWFVASFVANNPQYRDLLA